MRRSLALGVVAVVLVTVLTPVAAASAGRAASADTGGLGPEVQAILSALPPGDMTTVVVTLRERANLAAVPGATRAARLKGTITALQAKADASQAPIRAILRSGTAQGKVARTTPLWISNAISVTATAEVIKVLGARAEVVSITPDKVVVVPSAGTPEPNLTSVLAPAIWDLGYTGAGVVVASLDSGVDATHPDLASRWRGGTNSWYDPYGQNPTPTDFTGHGTAITGVMVGGDAVGTSIGMAPGAKWIAAKIFNNSGASTTTAIHQAFQWVLDPDGDPNTQDAPQVVNGSWSIGSGPGCNLAFQPDLQALRAAGILPVFAAGNFGSGGSSSVSPANYPEALSVGAVNNTDLIYSSSSRGPSTCGGRTRIFPDLVAPGVNIRTTDRYGLYQTLSGTSLSAPHAAGALALLVGSTPGLSPDRQQAALIATAHDLGSSGPDPIYGNGKLDVLAAHQWLQPLPDFAVTLTPGEASVTAGEAATYTASVAATDGFAADVSLSLSGLTAEQATWTFTPQVVPAGVSTSQLTITTTPTMPAGSYPLTVTAVSGTTTRTTTATLTTSTPIGIDLTGPATTSPVLTPNLTNGTAEVALNATGDDTATGGSGIVTGEYFIDTVSTDGSGTSMAVNLASPIASIEATITAATVGALGEGTHIVWVHSQDAAGNWGSMATATLQIDKTKPILSAVSASPNPTQGATSVTLSVTATDASAITGGEWFSGTDPGVGNGTPITTVTGTGPYSLTVPVNVSSWNEGAYILNVRVRDAAGNWSASSSTVLNVTAPLYFSTLGNTNPPGVGGSANSADIYNWSGSAFSRFIDASAAPYGLPTGANVDGYDRVDATHFYLSFSGTNTTVPGLGAVQDEDVVYYNNGVWSLYFDGTARGLTAGNQDLDAISVIGATNGTGGTLYFSTLGNTNPTGVGGAADDADIYSWAYGATGATPFTRVIDASAAPYNLPAAANVDGFVRVDATHFYLSFSADTTNVPVLGAVQDEDVIYNNNGTWSVYFNGTAHGLTSANLDVDAFDVP
ncbi:MAG: S8 family serine peptidase [Actinomycetota bacterium]